jgi:hypothetical protein
MKSKNNLTRKEFLFLHDNMFMQFIEENNGVLPSNAVRQRYGFDEESATMPSLRKSIVEHPTVKTYLDALGGSDQIETRYSLYQNYLVLSKKTDNTPTNAKINDLTLKAFLLYLGYNNLIDFKAEVRRSCPPTNYKVMFYTRDFKIDRFDLSIDYGAYPYEVEMQGFHIDTKRPKFFGKGIVRGKCLSIHLECPDRQGEQFFIISNIGSITDPEQIEVMIAAFTGFSTHGIPTCGECYVIKDVAENPFNSEEGLRRIAALLTLKRNRFVVKSTEIRSLDDLTTQGTPVTDLDSVAGTYVLWGIDKKGTWYQSKLEIDPVTFEAFYYTSVFKNYPSLKKLRCELSISNVLSKKLCITTKGKENKGREIVSFVMIEFEELAYEKEGHIFEAVYITMSRHNGKSVAGHIFLMKTLDFVDVRELDAVEVEFLLQGKPKLSELISKKDDRRK